MHCSVSAATSRLPARHDDASRHRRRAALRRSRAFPMARTTAADQAIRALGRDTCSRPASVAGAVDRHALALEAGPETRRPPRRGPWMRDHVRLVAGSSRAEQDLVGEQRLHLPRYRVEDRGSSPLHEDLTTRRSEACSAARRSTLHARPRVRDRRRGQIAELGQPRLASPRQRLVRGSCPTHSTPQTRSPTTIGHRDRRAHPALASGRIASMGPSRRRSARRVQCATTDATTPSPSMGNRAPTGKAADISGPATATLSR